MAGRDRFDPRSRRAVWTTWVPLAVTVTAAAVGIAAWMMTRDKENGESRSESAESSDDEHARAQPRSGQPSGTAGEAGGESGEWGSRVTNMFGSSVAAMGGALAAITEEERSSSSVGRDGWGGSDSDDADRNRNTPAASAQASTAALPAASGGRRRKTVAIVVSAEGHGSSGANDRFLENASLFSHIPGNIDLATTKLFVLIYAPGLQSDDPTKTPTDGSKAASPSAARQALETQALGLVEHKSMVFYFNTPKGYTYMLRHLEPELDVIYLQESLAGANGEWVTALQNWYRREIILVVGAEAGDGGLADSDSEDDADKDVWWKKPERVGLGRGVVVVDSSRMTDDWVRRIQGVE